jgi:hypothetical protein
MQRVFDRRFVNRWVQYSPAPGDVILEASALERFHGGDAWFDGVVIYRQPARVSGRSDDPREQPITEITRRQFEDFLGYQLLDYQWHWVRYYASQRKV